MKELRIAILKTLCYADVFDFPLKKEEIVRYLIKSSKLKYQNSPAGRGRPLDEVVLWTKKLIKTEKIKEKDNFYFLRGREKIVETRKKREKESRKKLEIAKRTAGFLKIIPTVKMVAVTGALAMNNSKKEDDIDFLIVSEKNRLWITRFLATILMEIFGKRRRPKNKNITDKICLNMFLDEEHLTVLQKEQDLFTAHEVIQLKPLWEKDNIYQKFLIANKWVEEFLGNAIVKLQNSKIPKFQNKKFLALSWNCKLCTLSFALFENALKHFQLFYMRKRRTTEVISDNIIRFHPKDARVWVLKKYQERIKKWCLN